MVALLLLASPLAFLLRASVPSCAARACSVRACADAPLDPPPAPLQTYDDAEARAIELFAEGSYERAIRMFELAQTLPGDGYDYVREKSGGMQGSATAPPNPRGLNKERFATAEQKLIAQYNIACCHAKLGDTPQAMEILSAYVKQVSEPLNQLNEMLVDEDLIEVRAELRELRDSLKTTKKKDKGMFSMLTNPIKEAAETIGVEWKD